MFTDDVLTLMVSSLNWSSGEPGDGGGRGLVVSGERQQRRRRVEQQLTAQPGQRGEAAQQRPAGRGGV